MRPISDPRQPWDKYEHESSRAYAAFCAYRDLGAERSIDRAFHAAGGQTEARAPRRWFGWSQQFQWAKRVEAWDSHLAAVDSAEKEKAAQRDAQEWAERRRHLRERKWRLSQALLDKGESVLKLPLIRTRIDKDGTTIVEPVRVRLADAARLGDVANQLGREAIEDARLEAEQTGRNAIQIVRAVFQPPWLTDSTAEAHPETDPQPEGDVPGAISSTAKEQS